MDNTGALYLYILAGALNQVNNNGVDNVLFV